MNMYMWAYDVKSDAIPEFENIYGARGKWVEFFKNGDGYLGTELHRDMKIERRYITIDYWISEEARKEFFSRFAEEYQKLDKVCESLFERETQIGTFKLCEPVE